MQIVKQKDKTKTYYKVSVSLYNTNRQVLEIIKRLHGGSINSDVRKDMRHKHLVYILRLMTRQAYLFLKTVEPYCIVKKGHIENTIKFYEYQVKGRHSRGNRLTVEDLAFYEQCHKVAVAYNKRLL